VTPYSVGVTGEVDVRAYAELNDFLAPVDEIRADAT
jgi:hypothetical protein